MRIVVLGLLLANLMVFGWSQWLAPAQEPAPVASAAESAPPGAQRPARILLASEAPAASTARGAEGVPAQEGPAVPGAIDPASPDPLPAAGDAPAGTAAAASLAAASGSAAPAAPARRCASMGPFTDLELTAQATLMLKQDGYAPRQRSANGAVPDGYMVVIPRLKDEADQARVVGRLNRGGLDDAFAIPKLDDGYAVSVGIFSQQRRAERRSQVVANMGFKPEIVERTRPGTVYWLDFDLKTPAAGGADPFTKSADASQKWQVVPCPGTGEVG